MAQQNRKENVIEGTWQEVSHRVAGIAPEQRVRLELLSTSSEPSIQTAPNHAMLDAMHAAEEIQRGMNPGLGEDSVAIIREARSGAIWAHETSE